MTGTVGLRQSILLGVIGLIPILLFPSRAKFLAALFGLPMLLGALASLGYWLIYGQEFSQSTIFIIFESNAAESFEFISSYLRWWHPLVLTGFCLIPFWMWKKIQPVAASLRYRMTLIIIFTLITCWPIINTRLIEGASLSAGWYHQMIRMEPVAPWNLVVGFIKYQQQLTSMNNILDANNQLPPLADFKEKNADAEKTFVLVIGESTNRQRMSLYGYSRKTTPMLDTIRDELTVFDDVVTARPYTIEALQQVLSFANSKNPNDFFDKPTLLNMMKQAGYEITWITNQQTQTRRNTMLTTLSQLADHQIYLNNNRNQNFRQYDDVVIQPLIEALDSSAKKKLIVIHLLGTHRKYSYRYPPSFAKFTTAESAPSWISEDLLEEYNSYDNAILYNDYVVAELIKCLKMKSRNSLLVYFSDHGEEVFDTSEQLFTGRNEAAPLPAMYTVPFIIWASPEYKSENHTDRWQHYAHRPYSTADFIYTWADITGINFKSMDLTRSLISSQFTPHPRWIGNPENPKNLQDYPFDIDEKMFTKTKDRLQPSIRVTNTGAMGDKSKNTAKAASAISSAKAF